MPAVLAAADRRPAAAAALCDPGLTVPRPALQLDVEPQNPAVVGGTLAVPPDAMGVRERDPCARHGTDHRRAVPAMPAAAASTAMQVRPWVMGRAGRPSLQRPPRPLYRAFRSPSSRGPRRRPSPSSRRLSRRRRSALRTSPCRRLSSRRPCRPRWRASSSRSSEAATPPTRRACSPSSRRFFPTRPL